MNEHTLMIDNLCSLGFMQTKKNVFNKIVKDFDSAQHLRSLIKSYDYPSKMLIGIIRHNNNVWEVNIIL